MEKEKLKKKLYLFSLFFAWFSENLNKFFPFHASLNSNWLQRTFWYTIRLFFRLLFEIGGWFQVSAVNKSWEQKNKNSLKRNQSRQEGNSVETAENAFVENGKGKLNLGLCFWVKRAISLKSRYCGAVLGKCVTPAKVFTVS